MEELLHPGTMPVDVPLVPSLTLKLCQDLHFKAVSALMTNMFPPLVYLSISSLFRKENEKQLGFVASIFT